VTTVGAWGLAAAKAPAPAAEPAPALAAEPAAAPVPAPVPAAQPAKEKEKERIADAQQRVRSQNNLKQILLAIHNYHDANGHLPADVTDTNGKPILSWRVQILPYIEQDNLYKQFKLDEPWDSENNKKLLADMPELLKTGIEPKDETKTYYQGFAGKGTVFEPGQQIKLTDITDGTSNTVMVVEAGPPVEWTKPADLPYDPEKKLPKLEGPFSNVLMIGWGDGSVRAVKRDIEEKTFRRIIERADGEVIDFDELDVKFPLTREEIKEAGELLKKNEKLFVAIAVQLREQQKLLDILAKGNPEMIKGLNLERLVGAKEGLEKFLEELKKQTEELRKEVGDKK